LFGKLRELRRQIAKEEGKLPYIVFSDRTLLDMCMTTSVDKAGMLAVNGFCGRLRILPEAGRRNCIMRNEGCGTKYIADDQQFEGNDKENRNIGDIGEEAWEFLKMAVMRKAQRADSCWKWRSRK